MRPAEERIDDIIGILEKTYPESRTALHYETPFQVLTATILSAQCTDEKVNEISPVLFNRYRTIAETAAAVPEDVEEIIRPTGFFRNKAKNIIGAAKKIMEDFGGEVPDSMNELLTLPGVARKTANIVLSSAFNKAQGIAVDTHVRRISQRLGLSRQKEPDKIENDLLAVVPKKYWLDFNYMIVSHGRKVCQARKPDCPACGLSELCPSKEEFFPKGKI